MITINYNGKTYKITRYDGIITQLEEWIMSGGLEEVKENKETLYGRSIEEQIREHLATPSILEKLREMKKDMLYERKREDLDSYESGQLKVIEDLLTSLETKHEHLFIMSGSSTVGNTYTCKCGETKEEPYIKTQNYGNGYEDFEKCTLNGTQPQFTPGQEIECSHTGKEWDWFKEKFTKMVGVNKDLYGVEGEESWYRFARPIEDKIDHDQVKENIRVMDEQDGVKIEPELPEVPNFNTTSELIIDDFSVLKQIEALTTFCQALARQKPTK